ncbi:pseudoazurin [Devosia sediminis]|uniref:Pseudoazurin n=1 Tax=Devosia sediminis TaxID=2798801 RepID=A0A934MRU8_9HYPH|nr:pseudoazurin [Devosia sediminis]MBJ3785794.1 pseudoazurin [Devosia sediminis]
MTIRAAILAASLSLLASVSALAAEHEVKMLNSGDTGRMVFEPAYLEIAAGDTVTFVATDPGHNAESIKDLIPEGATAFKGKLGETISVTFDVEGAYAYKCAPHLGMGMVGLIVVGEAPANLDAIAEARFPGKAKERFDEMLALAAE